MKNKSLLCLSKAVNQESYDLLDEIHREIDPKIKKKRDLLSEDDEAWHDANGRFQSRSIGPKPQAGTESSDRIGE